MCYTLRTRNTPGSMPTMTQTTTWTAILAPTGERGATGQIIAHDCEITVRDGAPLLGTSGVPIGLVDTATILDGHLIATGTLDPGQDLPTAAPTFDVGPDDTDEHTIDLDDGDGPDAGSTTYRHLSIHAVRTEFSPVWSEPGIGFVRNWCVHVIGPDDLIPMPDHATAVRGADRFNTWWDRYHADRVAEDPRMAEMLPRVNATVRPWPYGSDEHALALADLRADDPDGWLRD